MESKNLLIVAGAGLLIYLMAQNANADLPQTLPPAGSGADKTPPPANNDVRSQVLMFVNSLGGVTGPGPQLLKQAAAGSPELLNEWQWNFMLNKITGRQFNPVLTGYVAPPPATMTAAQYWAGLVNYAQGNAPSLSGMGGNESTGRFAADWSW